MKRLPTIFLLTFVVAGCSDAVAPILSPPTYASRSLMISFSGIAYLPTELGALGGLFAAPAAINNHSQMAVNIAGRGGARVEGGVMTLLPGASATTGINSTGVIAGEAGSNPAIWRGMEILDLGIPPNTAGASAAFISDQGYVAVNAAVNDGSLMLFRWHEATGYTLMNSLGGGQAQATGMNALGDIVGWSQTASFTSPALLWPHDSDTPIQIADFFATPVDINDTRQVTGVGGDNRPFFWDNGQLTQLPVPAGMGATPIAINAAGVVVGNLNDPETHVQHAVIWRQGEMTRLAPDSPSSIANAINDAGQVVGTFQKSDGSFSSFLWESGRFVELGGVAGGSNAVVISNSGFIGGRAASGAVLWTPAYAISLDIKPGSLTNPINPESNGETPVAVLGSSTFDVSIVDVASLRFGPGLAPARANAEMEDVNGDGFADLMLHFDTRAARIDCGLATATLTGRVMSGLPLQGTDGVKTVGCK